MTSFLLKLEENLSGWPLELPRTYGHDAENVHTPCDDDTYAWLARRGLGTPSLTAEFGREVRLAGAIHWYHRDQLSQEARSIWEMSAHVLLLKRIYANVGGELRCNGTELRWSR
jgi:hypothetical protein